MSDMEQNTQSVTGKENVVAVAEGKVVETPETEESKRLRENFGFFCPAALVYAVFYTFCMYKNGSGITFPLFVGGSLLFMHISLSKLGLTLKSGSIFYMAAMVLLGISTFCTDDARIIFFNKLGVFLLTMSLLLKQYCDTSKWNLGKFIGSICTLTLASVGELNRPFVDGKAYKESKARKMDKRVWYFVLGLMLGVPLVGVVVLLLASADAVFRQMTESLFEGFDTGNIFNIIVRIAFIFFASYALLSYLCKRIIKEDVSDKRVGEPVLAITITSMLTLLYLLFSGIQVAGLFLGKLKLPEEYTYAMYAREGFFQLLAVSLLNLVIVLVCMSYFKESKILKIILTAMSLCTFIMIASSAVRMIMYIRYYYLTFLRILVLWGLALLAVLFVGVIISIFQDSFPLFRYSVAVVTVLYLALSFAHPDYIIAKVNVANAPRESESWSRGEFFLTDEPYHDYAYLRNLSADAAPVLVPYLEELGYHMEAFLQEDALDYALDRGWGDGVSKIGGFGYYWMRELQQSTEDMGLRTFNLSRWLALDLTKRQSSNGQEASVQDTISEVLGLDVSSGEVITSGDTHGGFHGDGTTFVGLAFADEAFYNSVKENSRWKELPLDEGLTTLVYGIKSEEKTAGPYLTDDEGKTLFPHIENGYYYFEDRHSANETNEDLFGRGSFNLTIAIYDADTKTLYYCEFDT